MLLFGRMLIWGLCIWEAVECFKCGSMDYHSRNMKDFVTENDLNFADLAQEVLVKNFNIWPRDCFFFFVFVFLWYFGEESGYFLPLSEESA
jgi:hypothetical protein